MDLQLGQGFVLGRVGEKRISSLDCPRLGGDFFAAAPGYIDNGVVQRRRARKLGGAKVTAFNTRVLTGAAGRWPYSATT